jgi:hypothetical protein
MKKTSKKKLEYRMYYLVMYNISPIQQGIQALHATVEYALKYGKDPEYIDWAKNHKTVYLMNGGTSTDDFNIKKKYPVNSNRGTMETYCAELRKNKIKFANFHEPDLNYSMTAICFLVDERVYKTLDRNFRYENADGSFKWDDMADSWKLDCVGNDKKNLFLAEFLRGLRKV